MTSRSQPNNEFSKRDELLAGSVLGNLSPEEEKALATESFSQEEQTLLDKLKTTHSRIEKHFAPPLSDTIRERLLNSSKKKKHLKPPGLVDWSLAFDPRDYWR